MPSLTDLRPGNVQDIRDLVQIHERAFPGFFLTRLGPAFLAELYRGFLEGDGILWVAERDGRALGFVAGTIAPEGFFSRLLRRRGAHFLMASVGALLKSPFHVGRRLVGALFYRGERPGTLPAAALLSSIAVDPAAAGTGIGRLLVDAFVRTAEKRGCRHVYLTTDRDENTETNGFYRAVGFMLESTIRRSGGRWMNRFVRSLKPEEPGR